MDSIRSFSLSGALPIAACVVLLALTGCKAPEPPPPPPPPEVDVAKPTQRDVTIYKDFTGNTDAIESVEIRARVQGILESFHFTPASYVKKGDLLFTIEQAPYIASKEQAEADVGGSEAYVRRTESDLDRLEQAVKTNAVSQQEVSRATAERDQARSNLLAAKARLDQAEIDLAYTEIHSPINGVISRQFVDVGNLVGRTEATLLAAVFNIDPIYVYFEVNEQLVATVLQNFAGMKGRDKQPPEERTKVAVTLSQVDKVFEGYIDYIDPAADAETGTLQARAVLPNSEGGLLPGFFARIRVPGETFPDAVLVPETALSTDLGGRYVMLVDDAGLAQKRYIVPGQLEDDKLRVILEGLEPDERIVIRGLQRARPGMPVTVAGN